MKSKICSLFLAFIFIYEVIYRDRLRPVHQGDKLPAYMIRLMTSTMLPQTRNAICETYFVLCDEDGNYTNNNNNNQKGNQKKRGRVKGGRQKQKTWKRRGKRQARCVKQLY